MSTLGPPRPPRPGSGGSLAGSQGCVRALLAPSLADLLTLQDSHISVLAKPGAPITKTQDSPPSKGAIGGIRGHSWQGLDQPPAPGVGATGEACWTPHPEGQSPGPCLSRPPQWTLLSGHGLLSVVLGFGLTWDHFWATTAAGPAAGLFLTLGPAWAISGCLLGEGCRTSE